MPRTWDYVREVGDDMLHLSVVADMLESMGFIRRNPDEEFLGQQSESWTVVLPGGEEKKEATRMAAAEAYMAPYIAKWFVERANLAEFRPNWLKEDERLQEYFHVGDQVDDLNTLREGAAELDLSFTLFNPTGATGGIIHEGVRALGDASRELARALQRKGPVSPRRQGVKERHGWIERMCEVAEKLEADAKYIAEGNLPPVSSENFDIAYRMVGYSRRILRLASEVIRIGAQQQSGGE